MEAKREWKVGSDCAAKLDAVIAVRNIVSRHIHVLRTAVVQTECKIEQLYDEIFTEMTFQLERFYT